MPKIVGESSKAFRETLLISLFAIGASFANPTLANDSPAPQFNVDTPIEQVVEVDPSTLDGLDLTKNYTFKGLKNIQDNTDGKMFHMSSMDEDTSALKVPTNKEDLKKQIEELKPYIKALAGKFKFEFENKDFKTKVKLNLGLKGDPSVRFTALF